MELLENAKGTFFPSGVAQPSDDGKQILSMLAHELGQLPNTVSIEGHTDAKPFAPTANYGNWELSADRANAARRMMQENGMGEKQVTQVRGYADQRLRNKKDPEDPANRRISLIVHYVDQPGGEGDPASAPQAIKPPGQTAAVPVAAPAAAPVPAPAAAQKQ